MPQGKILFINPAGSHNIFIGWQYFFNHFFDFHNYNHGGEIRQHGNYHSLIPTKIIIIFKNFIALYDKSTIDIKSTDTVIIGDIFTNTLCYQLKQGNIIYYSEYFNYGKNTIKKILFYMLCLTLFHNKKFIVPTRLSEQTFQRISSKVLYFPPIYYGEIYENKKQDYAKIHLLFVGRMSQKFKNIDFLIENYLSIRRKYSNIQLTLVGELVDSKYLSGDLGALRRLGIDYVGSKTTEELNEIYRHSDICILPSNSDPIGAVVLEAMAHGCAVLLSDTVGASSYIEDGRNGFIFKTNDAIDFQNKLGSLLDEHKKLYTYKANSLEILRSQYWYQNNTLLENKYKDITQFINY